MAKKNWLKKIIAISLSAFLVLAPDIRTVKADWVSDWIQQKTSESPNYFQGQQRGYFTLGSFSARWQHTQTFSPISISMPSIKVGCGGIDIFSGALGFVNPQYLVQQLQAMLQAAPAVAFDLALKTLCEQCSQTIKAIEAFIQKLNSLQFDACKTTRAAVFTLASAIDPEIAERNQAEADEAHQTLSGIGKMFTDIFRSEQSIPPSNPNIGTPASAQTNYYDMIKGCPSDIQYIFSRPNTTLLQQLANTVSLPYQYIDLIRGEVGDIQVAVASNAAGKLQLVIVPLPPCKQNDSTSIKDFYNGNVWAEDASGNCYNAGVMNLTTYVQNSMQSIINKMQNKGQGLTATEYGILQVSPISLYQTLKASILAGDINSTAATLSDLTVKAYALGAMEDLYVLAENLFYRMNKIIHSESMDSPDCKVDITAAHPELLDGFIKLILKKKEMITQDYQKSAQELAAINDIIQHYQDLKSIIDKQTAGVINRPAVATM